MGKAVKCPICGGSGKLLKGNGGEYMVVEVNYERCHGCDGRGWVEVNY